MLIVVFFFMFGLAKVTTLISGNHKQNPGVVTILYVNALNAIMQYGDNYPRIVIVNLNMIIMNKFYKTGISTYMVYYIST